MKKPYCDRKMTRTMKIGKYGKDFVNSLSWDHYLGSNWKPSEENFLQYFNYLKNYKKMPFEY